MQALVYKAQAVAKETKLEYELVTRRVIAEFEQFKSQKVIDMRDIMLNFVRMQVSLCEKEGREHVIARVKKQSVKWMDRKVMDESADYEMTQGRNK